MSDVPQQPGEPQASTPTPPQQPYPSDGQYAPPAGQYPPPGQYPPAGQYPPPAPYQPVGPQPMTPNDERLWASLSQYGGILGFLPPLIIMLVFGDRSAFVRRHSVESLNFQITLFIAYMVASISIIFLIGIVLLPLIWIAAIILCVMAGMAANRGEDYRYPLNIRFIH
jgi:uncharacterized Tic20 family protein